MPVSKPIDIDLARELFTYSPEMGGSCLIHKAPRKKAKPGAMAGSTDSQGVWRVKVGKGSFRAHRVAYAMLYGVQPPQDLFVDWAKKVEV